MRKVLNTAVILSSMIIAQPAFASIAEPGAYSPALLADAGIEPSLTAAGVEEDQFAEVCVPPEAQYLPTFLRDADGKIVGIDYTIIEYVC